MLPQPVPIFDYEDYDYEEERQLIEELTHEREPYPSAGGDSGYSVTD